MGMSEVVNMKNQKIKYLLYLICLHGVCIIFTVSCFLFPKWGYWVKHSRFLNSSFPVYPMMIISIFPLFSVLPYFVQYDFPNSPTRKKVIFAVILITNVILILTYTAFLHKMMG